MLPLLARSTRLRRSRTYPARSNGEPVFVIQVRMVGGRARVFVLDRPPGKLAQGLVAGPLSWRHVVDGRQFRAVVAQRFDHNIDHGAPSLVGNEVSEAMGFVATDVELSRHASIHCLVASIL